MPPPTPKPAHDLPLPPARVTADGVRVLTGVPYADLPGVRPLELDLYLPPGGDAPRRRAAAGTFAAAACTDAAPHASRCPPTCPAPARSSA